MAQKAPLVLAVDQGTGSTKALLIDEAGQIQSSAAVPVSMSTPAPGHVEQSAEEIWQSFLGVAAECLREVEPGSLTAIGLSNQRESVVLWERANGRPLGPLLSWQDQRTSAQHILADDDGHAETVRRRSGLPLDPMFSALKARWLLDRHDPDRRRARAGELCLGTIDSWLLFCISGGAHVIETGNAARTQLLNVHTRQWDDELLGMFDVPIQSLPTILPSDSVFCESRGLAAIPDGVPVCGVLGDSHAALFAQKGWQVGRVKATYGSGSSVMAVAPPSTDAPPDLCLTVAWDVGGPAWALEGTNRSAGSTLVWLASLFGTTPDELVSSATDVSDAGLYLVPAFNGLAAPWWDDTAVGLVSGLRMSTTRNQLVHAAVESIAHQVEDVVSAFERNGLRVSTLLADGGPAANSVLMQLQADLGGRRVERASTQNLSAMGAGYVAGISCGIWTVSDVEALVETGTTFEPAMPAPQRDRLRQGWLQAVARSRLTVEGP